jgi:hypothetical protein
MANREMTFVVQCAQCNEDIVFRQAHRTNAVGIRTLSAMRLTCSACSSMHVYRPADFVPAELTS